MAFPKNGLATTVEEDNLTAAMIPVVYWLVFFSIVVHGLSIPALDAFYRWRKIPPITEEEPSEIQVLSENEALPNNAYVTGHRRSMVVHNRFSRSFSVANDDGSLSQFAGSTKGKEGSYLNLP